MTELPVFSIILTVCNAADAMECTIASLSSLEESSWECIILDNGSSDDTGRRARLAVDAEERLRYVYQQRQDLHTARCNALKVCSGRVILMLGAGDKLHPDALRAFAIAQ